MGILLYKDIGIEDEGSFGASVAGTANRIHVISTDINLDPNKEMVEDTTNNVKGHDRVQGIRNTIEGSINSYLEPKTFHEFIELVLGTAGAIGSSVGTSATLYTYTQNTNGTMLSKTVNIDRSGLSQEKYQGVRASQLEISWSDNKAELNMDVIAKTRAAGVAMSDTGSRTTPPFTFAEVAVSIGNTLNYFGAGLTTLYVSDGSVTYANGLEATHLSGSKNINRSDPKIPTLEGNFTIFHENNGLVDGTFGCSEYALRIALTSAACGGPGLIAGATPYYVTIDIPRAVLTTNVRNYEQNAFAVEEINFMGLFETGSSALITVNMTADIGF